MKYTKHRINIVSSHFLYFALGVCCLLVAALANSAAPARAALKPLAPDYEGLFDRADCTFLGGYAFDANAQDQTIYVDIYDGGNLLITVPADRFRRDLANQGMANPYHGFLVATPSSVKDGNFHAIYAKFSGTVINLTSSPRDIVCNASVFPNKTPETTASGQGSTWEQGVEISSSVDGTISKVAFWRAAEELPGGHVANIWTTSGTRLASSSFNETSAPGWQYATLSTPLHITAGVRYRVTYNINTVVAKTFNVFTNGPVQRGPLTAWRSYFGTPGGQFPTSSSTSNLFADVVFNAPQ